MILPFSNRILKLILKPFQFFQFQDQQKVCIAKSWSRKRVVSKGNKKKDYPVFPGIDRNPYSLGMQRIHRRGPHPVRGRSTRRRVDSSVSAACTSSPQPRCSPAFTCLPLLLAPIRGRTRSTLGRPFKRIDNSFPTQARLQRLPHRLQTERERG